MVKRIAKGSAASEVLRDYYLQGAFCMKATGIVRRIDDLGRVVIPKEIRRTMRIREGDPLQITLTQTDHYILGMLKLSERISIYELY